MKMKEEGCRAPALVMDAEFLTSVLPLWSTIFILMYSLQINLGARDRKYMQRINTEKEGKFVTLSALYLNCYSKAKSQ